MLLIAETLYSAAIQVKQLFYFSEAILDTVLFLDIQLQWLVKCHMGPSMSQLVCDPWDQVSFPCCV